MSKLQDKLKKGASPDAETPVEMQYVAQHPDQLGQVLGYADRTEDLSGFRDAVQAALDEGKRIVFYADDDDTLDQLPDYTVQ